MATARFLHGEPLPEPSVVLCDEATELQYERMAVPLLVETTELKELDALSERTLLSCQGCDGGRIRSNGAALCALADSTLAARLRAAKELTRADTWEV